MPNMRAARSAAHVRVVFVDVMTPRVFSGLATWTDGLSWPECIELSGGDWVVVIEPSSRETDASTPCWPVAKARSRPSMKRRADISAGWLDTACVSARAAVLVTIIEAVATVATVATVDMYSCR